jgi:hypothetical protein
MDSLERGGLGSVCLGSEGGEGKGLFSCLETSFLLPLQALSIHFFFA